MVDNELIRAKSNLEQYLLISTSEGEVRGEYQEYVKSNFGRIFEGYTEDEFKIVSEILTEDLPRNYGVAIDECVQSTLDILDSVGSRSTTKLNYYKKYIRLFSEEYGDFQACVLGNELIKHYFNYSENENDLFYKFIEGVENSFVNCTVSEPGETLPTGLTNYFSQDFVVNYFKNISDYHVSFERLFHTFNKIRKLPLNCYGLKPRITLEKYVCKLIDNSTLEDNLSVSLGQMLNQYVLISNLELENVSDEKKTQIKGMLTHGFLNFIPLTSNPTNLSDLLYNSSISFRVETSEEGIEKHLQKLDFFNEVIGDYVDGDNFDMSDFDVIIKNLRINYNVSSFGTSNFNKLLSIIYESNRINNLDVNYVNDMVRFQRHSYLEGKDCDLNLFFSNPEIIDKLNHFEADKDRGENGRYHVIRNDPIKTNLFYLINCFGNILSMPNRELLVSNRDSEHGEKVNCKEYLIGSVCNLFDLTDNHVGLVTTFRHVFDGWNLQNYSGFEMDFHKFVSLKELLEKLSERSDFNDVLEKVNYFIPGFKENSLNLNYLLTYLDKKHNNNELDLKYVNNAIHFFTHKYNKNIPAFLEEYLSMPRVIEKLNNIETDEDIELNQVNQVSNRDKDKSKLYHLMNTFRKIFFQVVGDRRLLPEFVYDERRVVNDKEYLITNICDLLDLTDNNGDLIKTFKHTVGYFTRTGDLSSFAVLENRLRKLASREDFNNNILPKVNNYVLGFDKGIGKSLDDFFNVFENNFSLSEENFGLVNEYIFSFEDWSNVIKPTLKISQIELLTGTYNLLKNTLLQKPESNPSHNSVKTREFLNKELKQSFISSLDEVVDYYKDESIEVQKHSVINYCKRISQLVREDHFDIHSFISELRGVQ